MWKKIFNWSAQGVVQGGALIVATSAASAVWALIDMETVVGVAAVLTIGFITCFGLWLLHLPNIKSMTSGRVRSAETLGQIKEGTLYWVVERPTEGPDKTG